MNQEHSQDMTFNRRRYGRIEMSMLDCAMGRIMNLSAGGMVVLGPNATHYRIEVDIGDDREAVIVLAERIWSRRNGFRRHLVGYKFVDPPPNLLQRVNGAELGSVIARVI